MHTVQKKIIDHKKYFKNFYCVENIKSDVTFIKVIDICYISLIII